MMTNRIPRVTEFHYETVSDTWHIYSIKSMNRNSNLNKPNWIIMRHDKNMVKKIFAFIEVLFILVVYTEGYAQNRCAQILTLSEQNTKNADHCPY